MDASTKPSLEMARNALPSPLFNVITWLMDLQLRDCALVGGTALSGFYTGHRRSDDIDLFTKDEISHKSAVVAMQSLKQKSVLYHKEVTSPYYYHANCSLEDHYFTIDIVNDSHLFEVGEFHLVEKKLEVASLHTLLRMKAATLVSRCSEKDLSDLLQLFALFSNLTIDKLIDLGHSIDAGVTAESMLASIGGATLNKEACDFSVDPKIKKEQVFKEIRTFQKLLIKSLQEYLKKQPPPPLGELLKQARKILR